MERSGVQRLGGGVKGNLFQDKVNAFVKWSLKDVMKLGFNGKDIGDKMQELETQEFIKK